MSYSYQFRWKIIKLVIEQDYGIREVAKMSRSSFYYKEIKRDYHEVKEAILSLYKKNRKRDGYRPMTFKLRQMGFNLNHKTVLKLMNELDIHSILRKKKTWKTWKNIAYCPEFAES